MFLAFFTVATMLLPLNKLEAAARPQKYSVSYSTIYDLVGNAYVTVTSSYTNTGKRPVPARVNYKFANIGENKISEFNTLDTCLKKMTLLDEVKFICGKEIYSKPYVVQSSETIVSINTFKIDKTYVDKDKKLKMEVIFKDGVMGNIDKSLKSKIDLENPGVIIYVPYEEVNFSSSKRGSF